MGFAIAEAAKARGADVTVVAGSTAIATSRRHKFHQGTFRRRDVQSCS